jgi:hypothetical protein
MVLALWLDGVPVRGIGRFLSVPYSTVRRYLGDPNCCGKRPTPYKASARPRHRPAGPDALDRVSVLAIITERRATGQTDLAIALSLRISAKSVRDIAGPRNGRDHSRAAGCTPCPHCDRPIFKAKARGVCSACAQRPMPASVTLVTTGQRVIPASVALTLPRVSKYQWRVLDAQKALHELQAWAAVERVRLGIGRPLVPARFA